jgi:uncharacterized membrane protein
MDNILQKILIGLISSPVILVISGTITLIFPPRKINLIYGFRTKRAMKSQEGWDYANKLTGKILLIMGMITLVLNIIIYIITINSSIEAQHTIYNVVAPGGALLFFVLLCSLYIIVQTKLKNKGY